MDIATLPASALMLPQGHGSCAELRPDPLRGKHALGVPGALTSFMQLNDEFHAVERSQNN